MTIKEAIKAVKNGNKVTHKDFVRKDEYVVNDENGKLIDENGKKMQSSFFSCRISDDWSNDWNIFNNAPYKYKTYSLYNTIE